MWLFKSKPVPPILPKIAGLGAPYRYPPDIGTLGAWQPGMMIPLAGSSATPKIATPEVPATPEGISMANEFVSILEKIGTDAEKVGEYLLADAVKYLPFAATLAGFIFPPAVAPLNAANAVADLLQNSVASAEILLAKASLTGYVGPQKLATVLQIVTGAVTSLLNTPTITADLKSAGVTVNTAYITSLVNAVVAFLNVQGVVTTTGPATLPAAA